MQEKLLQNQDGVTFLELMMVIVIMGILSIAFYNATASASVVDDIKTDTDSLASDFRTVRNMVTSRTAHKFSGQTEETFPAGGYGIYMEQKTNSADTWIVYADNGSAAGYQSGQDEQIGDTRLVSDNRIKIIDPAEISDKKFYITFSAENKIKDNDLTLDASNRYIVEFKFAGKRNNNNQITEMGYHGILRVAELSDDGSVIIPLGTSFSSVTPPGNPPPGGGGGKGRIKEIKDEGGRLF